MRKIRTQFLIQFMTFLFIGMGSLSYGAVRILDKKMDVNYQNQKISYVLDDLSKKFDCDILYNHQEVDALPEISYKATNATLTTILDGCLKNSKLTYKIVDNIIVISIKKAVATTPRNRTVKGKVIDSDGNPLPGTTLMLIDKSRGTSADARGEFSLTINENQPEIMVRYVGMKTQIINLADYKSNSIEITLEEEKQSVAEVVVTGYGKIDKKSFTGTTVQISQEQLLQVSPNNIIKSIQMFDPSFRIMDNVAMGSDPNSLPEFYIRGRSGIGNTQISVGDISEAELRNNPNLPTFILNGYEVNVQKIFDLDPTMVNSITILKDAASTAIYGSRASNGVIVIETVTPKQGKMRVNYSFNANVSTPDLSVYNLLNASEKLQLEKNAGFFDPLPSDMPNGAIAKEKAYYDKLSQINRGVDTYWLSQPVTTSFSSKHNLSLDGGVDKILYGVNLRLDNTNGVMRKSGRDNKSINLSLQYRTNNLIFRNTLEWSNLSTQESPYGSFSTYATRNPYDTFKDENGEYVPTLQQWGINSPTENPLYDANLMSYNKSKTDEIVNNFNVKWNIIEGLRVEAQAVIRYSASNKKNFRDPESSGFAKVQLTEKGSLDINNGKATGWETSLFASYNKSFGKSHLSATLGNNLRENFQETTSYRLTGFGSGSTSDQNFASQSTKPRGGSAQNRLVGLFLSFNYTYNNIYLFDASGRYDGASQFGRSNKFAPFWSFGTGINIHNYAFMKQNAPWVNNLKIRGTYGILGNANFNQNLSKMIYRYNFDSWYVDGMGATVSSLGNPNLEWEQSENMDLGLDLTLFDDFTASFGYYKKVTNNLIGDISIPSSTGFTSYKSNLGKIVNKGYELSVNVAVINNKQASLRIFGSMAHNENKLMEVSDALKSYNELVNNYYKENKSFNYSLLRYKEGSSMTSIYAMKSLGINPVDGKEIFQMLDGTPSYEWDPSQHVICGDTEPTVSGSFGFNLSYKGLFLFTGFTYEYGGEMENRTLLSKVENANIYGNVDRRVFTDRWVVPGNLSKYKSLKDWQNNTRTTSRFIQKNNFIAFNSITVGYSFNQSLLNKIKVRALKASLSMNDLGRRSTIVAERGTSYPFARSYNLTINIGF